MVINAFELLNISSGIYGPTIYQVSGVNALSKINGSQNKNIAENGGAPATCSEYPADRLSEKISGILSSN